MRKKLHLGTTGIEAGLFCGHKKDFKPWEALKKANESLKRLLCPNKDRCVHELSCEECVKVTLWQNVGLRRNSGATVIGEPSPIVLGHKKCKPEVALWFVKMFWTTCSRGEGWCTSIRITGHESRLHGVAVRWLDLWRRVSGSSRTMSVLSLWMSWIWSPGTLCAYSVVCLSWKVSRLVCFLYKRTGDSHKSVL